MQVTWGTCSSQCSTATRQMSLQGSTLPLTTAHWTHSIVDRRPLSHLPPVHIWVVGPSLVPRRRQTITTTVLLQCLVQCLPHTMCRLQASNKWNDRFLARCHKRRLRQALLSSPSSLLTIFCVFPQATLIVFGNFAFFFKFFGYSGSTEWLTGKTLLQNNP